MSKDIAFIFIPPLSPLNTCWVLAPLIIVGVPFQFSIIFKALEQALELFSIAKFITFFIISYIFIIFQEA